MAYTKKKIAPFPVVSQVTPDDYNSRWLQIVSQGNDAQDAIAQLYDEAADNKEYFIAFAEQKLAELKSSIAPPPVVTSEVTQDADTVPSNKAVATALRQYLELAKQYHDAAEAIHEPSGAASVGARAVKSGGATDVQTILQDLQRDKLNASAVTKHVTKADSTIPSNAAVTEALVARDADIAAVQADVQAAREDASSELQACLIDIRKQVVSTSAFNSAMRSAVQRDELKNYTPLSDSVSYSQARVLVEDNPANLPPGGRTGEVATKASNADYDVVWEPVGCANGNIIYAATIKLLKADWKRSGTKYYNTATLPGLEAKGQIHSYSPTDASRYFWCSAEAWMHTVTVDGEAVFEAVRLPQIDFDVQVFKTARGRWGSVTNVIQEIDVTLLADTWVADGDSFTQIVSIEGLLASGFVHGYSPNDAGRLTFVHNDVWMHTVIEDNVALFEAATKPDQNIIVRITQAERGDWTI